MHLSMSCSSAAQVGRFVREVPDKPPHFYISRSKRVIPRYMAECTGTPRREYPVNSIDGIRLLPTFNPYHKITPEKKQILATWKSRDWRDWNPYSCYVGFGGSRYKLPEDLRETKNELGIPQQPKLQKSYVSEIRKQYVMNGLPWVWDNKFYSDVVRETDKEPEVAPSICKKQGKSEKVKDALRNMEQLRLSYLQERRDAKRYHWWEHVVKELGGDQALEQYARIRKVPRLV